MYFFLKYPAQSVPCLFSGLTIQCWITKWCALPWGILFLPLTLDGTFVSKEVEIYNLRYYEYYEIQVLLTN